MDAYVETLIAGIEHDTLRRMVALWNRKRAGRAAPLRSDFDPSEMVFALGDLSLFDVESNPERFWCRLDGTRQVELFGVDCTGKYLDTCFSPEYYAVARKSFAAAVASGRPGYYQRQIPYAGRIIRYEAVVLPLSRKGGSVDMLMIALTPHWS